MVEFEYEELVKATENFCESRLVGRGSHGSVYKAILHHHHNNSQNDVVVAVKRSSGGLDDEKLHNEIGMLSSLSSTHIIKFLGTSHNQKLLLVTEFMSNGSLHDLLHSSSFPPPPWPKRVEIALQIANAVRFLHEGGCGGKSGVIVHRDIKSANVLFDSNWDAKLADFGLAVADSLSQVTSQEASQQLQPLPAGTIGYLDPCYTTPTKLSTKNDVFSFGVVLLEIISGKKVFDVTRESALMVDWTVPLIESGRFSEVCDERIVLPMFMEGTVEKLLCVAARCVSQHEETRPSIGEVVMELEETTRLIERVRAPNWTSYFFRSRMRRKLIKHSKQHSKSEAQQQGGRMLLREVLALN
ncbi:putative Kinase APK1B chloroplast [Tripterygium wilfordii]|uniref:non-specific serine/threonine protein kinase n=1 Tax=Tripterygium wilfordii TaxID=458696 RepID=A0A7J7CGL0_TRIWF|nr:serine/threonine-protein kinase-like protein At5g23170 [Tripterygium wilfordii]KAF5733177.1 putative Kinase APK1B chloroplast [Tripterygium wilfordii]